MLLYTFGIRKKKMNVSHDCSYQVESLLESATETKDSTDWTDWTETES